jgi:PqqD family protein of HPr-rel-A system
VESEIAANDRPRKAEGIEIHVVDDQCVVYDTGADRVHYLNPTAALVLEFCDGNRSPDDIATLVQEAYRLPAAPAGDVGSCLATLREMGIVR